MDPERFRESILANAQEISRLDASVKSTSRLRGRSPEDLRNWEAACREFHARYDLLAFPGGYEGALERIVAGEPEAIEAAICFLEVRPYFFRSGYMYKDILRKIKRAPLSKSQAPRVATIIQAHEAYRAKRGEKA